MSPSISLRSNHGGHGRDPARRSPSGEFRFRERSTSACEDENALALLSCILTATPGTAWLEFDRQTGILLIHVLDLENGEALVRA